MALARTVGIDTTTPPSEVTAVTDNVVQLADSATEQRDSAPVKRGRGRPKGVKDSKPRQKPKQMREGLRKDLVWSAIYSEVLIKNGSMGYPLDHKFEFHPLCEMFPLLVGEEFEELVSDIRQHGQREVGTLHKGKILDGRNRYRACREAGVPFRAREFDGKDPLGFVISANIRRRHLSPQQKRELLAMLYRDDPVRSDRAIARTVGVDNKTAAAVRRDLESREEIPHVEKRTDTAGRQQPATKPNTLLAQKLAKIDAEQLAADAHQDRLLQPKELVEEFEATRTIDHEPAPPSQVQPDTGSSPTVSSRPTARAPSNTDRRIDNIIDSISRLDKPDRKILWEMLVDRWQDEMTRALAPRRPFGAPSVSEDVVLNAD